MIIYEDENILAINKPAGLLVHPIQIQEENSKPQALNSKKATSYKLQATSSLVDWLLKNYPDIGQVGDPSTSSGQANLRPGIVHRLDKETSGVLIVAKNQKTFEFLKEQFKQRKIQKTYTALVKGVVNPPAGGKKGIINSPIKRFSKTRDAVTEYKIIKKFKDYTLLEVYPKTGRTHQIRIHLKSIGHPIACDKLYSKKSNCVSGLKRHFLHASSLELTLPNKARIRLEANMPDDLQNTLKSLE